MAGKNGDSCLEQIVTLSDIAVLSGYGERSVQRLTKSGLIKLARDDKGRLLRGRYVIGLTLPVLAEHTRDLATTDDPDERLYAQSRARRMTAAAESSELALKLQRCELLERDVVNRVVLPLLTALKNHVLAMSARITRQLVPYCGGKDNERIVYRILNDGHRACLTEASRFTSKDIFRAQKQALARRSTSRRIEREDNNDEDADD